MKADHQIVLCVLATVFGFAVGQVLTTDSVRPLFEYFVAPVVTLGAAYAGAHFAFLLQEQRAKADKDDAAVRAANGAIFEISRWCNTLIGLESQFIREFRDDPARHLKIMPMAELTIGRPHFDFESLNFLFSSSDPNLPMLIHMWQQDVASTLDVVDQRSRMHVNELQPALERLQKRIKIAEPPMQLIHLELGEMRTQQLMILTNIMIECIGRGIDTASNLAKQLRAVSNAMYPAGKLIRFELPKRETAAG